MSLDFRPKPGAASNIQMIAAQTRMELRLLARNGEQLLLTLVIPIVLLVAATRTNNIVDLGPGRMIDILTPGILALAILSTSFTSLAIATGFERRYGVLKRLGASPLPAWGLLAGKVVAVVIVEVVQLVILCSVAWALGWAPSGGYTAVPWMLVLILLGTAAFGALGLLIAGVMRAEATLAVANLVYVLLLVGGGLLVPVSRYPEAVQPAVELLPTGALASGMRDALAGLSPTGGTIVVLALWSVCAGLLTARTFRWE